MTARHFTRSWQMLAIAMAAFFVVGCTGNETAWTVTDIQADRGHDTMEDEAGLMYHNYFRAVVLRRKGETVSLIYENQLPDDVDIAIGDTVNLSGLNDATYSETWEGYWLHEVTLTPTPDGG